MEVTSSTPPNKPARTRAKAKAAEATAKPAAPKKSRSKKAAAPTSPETVAASEPRQLTTDELRGRIAMEAYFIAAQRNFAPGGEVADWLEAERRVLSR